MPHYHLYTDESNDFDNPSHHTLIGGLWGPEWDFIQAPTLNEFGKEIKSRLGLQKHQNSVSQWSQDDAGKDYLLVLEVLKECVDFLKSRNFTFVTLRWEEDMYPSDENPLRAKRNKPKRRFNNMLMTLAGNLAGRNPWLNPEDSVKLHPGTRTMKVGDALIPLFSEEDLHMTWDIWTDQKMVQPIAEKIYLKASGDGNPEFTGLVFLADLLLGAHGMQTRNAGGHRVDFANIMQQIPAYHFSYDLTHQKRFERLVHAFLNEDWFEFMDLYLLIDRKHHHREEIRKSYHNLTDRFREKALLKISQTPEQATKVLRWISETLQRKESERYVLLPQLFEAISRFESIRQDPVYQACWSSWKNHEGSKSAGTAEKFRDTDQRLEQMNKDPIGQYEHDFDFITALEKVEYCALLRENYTEGVFGKNVAYEDSLLGSIISHRATLKAWLGDYSEAFEDFEQALQLYGEDKFNKGITTSYALAAACESKDKEKILNYRQKYLDILGYPIERLVSLIKKPSQEIQGSDAFFIKMILKSLLLHDLPDLRKNIQKLDVSALIAFAQKKKNHPYEGVLIQLGRYMAHSEPEKARVLFKSAFDLNASQTPSQVLWLISATGAVWGGLLFNDQAFAEQGLARLRVVQESGHSPSVITPDLNGKGWFDPVFQSDDWQEQARRFVDRVRMTYL